MGSLLLTSPSNHLALRVSDSRVAKGHVLLMRNIVITAIWSPGSHPTFLCCGPLVGPVACGRRYSRAATGKTLTVAVWIQPMHADDSITLYLGSGRERSGQVGNTGFNAYKGLADSSTIMTYTSDPASGGVRRGAIRR